MLESYRRYLETEIDSEDFASELEYLYPGITLREIIEYFDCYERSLNELISDSMSRGDVLSALRIVLQIS